MRVLLTASQGGRIAERVAIITDEDPTTPGDRRDALTKLAKTLGAEDRLEVFIAHPTLEPELLSACPANVNVVEKAFNRQRPQAGPKAWEQIKELTSPAEREDLFQKEFKRQELRKGDFAQDVAELSTQHPDFTVPQYLRNAISWISEAQT